MKMKKEEKKKKREKAPGEMPIAPPVVISQSSPGWAAGSSFSCHVPSAAAAGHIWSCSGSVYTVAESWIMDFIL